jgi:hypothetical protein
MVEEEKYFDKRAHRTVTRNMKDSRLTDIKPIKLLSLLCIIQENAVSSYATFS